MPDVNSMFFLNAYAPLFATSCGTESSRVLLLRRLSTILVFATSTSDARLVGPPAVFVAEETALLGAILLLVGAVAATTALIEEGLANVALQIALTNIGESSLHLVLLV